MRAYCKGGHVIAKETAPVKAGVTVRDAHGQSVSVAEGFTTPGGIILLDDKLATSPTSHEMEIVASATPDLQPGDRVVVYLGGDDGGVSSAGISAFLPFNGEECAMVPERYLWARVKDGELMPRRNVVLVERDDAAMQRYAFNSSPIVAPDGVMGVDLMEHGISAANREDPGAGGARTRDSVTLQYARVARVGPDVKDTDLVRGVVVAFSPSYMCTTLVRQIRNRDGKYDRHYYALVSAEEIFFVAGE